MIQNLPRLQIQGIAKLNYLALFNSSLSTPKLPKLSLDVVWLIGISYGGNMTGKILNKK